MIFENKIKLSKKTVGILENIEIAKIDGQLMVYGMRFESFEGS